MSAGEDRANGGAGYDTVELAGAFSDYVIEGDAARVVITDRATGDRLSAVNVERLVFLTGATQVELDNPDTSRQANWKTANAPSADPRPFAADDGGAIARGSITIADLLTNDVTFAGALTLTRIDGKLVMPGSIVDIAGKGIVTVLGDGSVSIRIAPSAKGRFEFGYSVSDGVKSADALVSFQIRSPSMGTVGNDLMIGDAAPDRMDGLAGRDRLFGHAGPDTLIGGRGGDTLLGGAGNDRLAGGNNADYLNGQAGNDILAGGAGRDVLVGGRGADRFTMEKRQGRDVIEDFSLAAGDRIDLRAFSLDSFEQLQAHIRQTPAGALIVFGKAAFLLEGVDASQLDSGDFLL
jgi:Ca2+-binding RTX toxin-like protein